MIEFFAYVCAALYHSVVLFLCGFQDYAIFPGSLRPMFHPAVAEVTVEKAALESGRTFRIAVAQPERPKAVLLYFVGNAEDLTGCRYWARSLCDAQGYLVISPEYPGYGPGRERASKASCVEAVTVATRRAVAKARALGVPLVVGGHSFGTFAATRVAAQGVGKKLLLLAPPVSILARGQAMFPVLPIRWMLWQNFDNLAHAPKVRCPTLVVHGTADRIVPVGDGRAVAARIPGARLEVVPGGSHDPNKLYLAAGGVIREFLK